MGPLFGDTKDPNLAGVEGRHNEAGVGVKGHCRLGIGVHGNSDAFDKSGVLGTNSIGAGVQGVSLDPASSGVVGSNTSPAARGVGVTGQSINGVGVAGTGTRGGFFEGTENIPHGDPGVGVHAVHSGDGSAVHAEAQGTGAAIFAVGGEDPNDAGIFEGNVTVRGGDITLTDGADCAEEFEIAAGASVEPGTVMVLGEEGTLLQSQHAYDKRVAGVVSGAGDYKTGLILDKQQSQSNRTPVALLGKVYCKVDASEAAIEVGDLLTTSHKPGCAMKADDPLKAFGAVIGKALRPLKAGRGMVPILIALQ